MVSVILMISRYIKRQTIVYIMRNEKNLLSVISKIEYRQTDLSFWELDYRNHTI